MMKSHRYVVLDLVQNNGWTCGAELGLASGQLFGLLLGSCPELFLIGVDHMARVDRAEKVRSLARQYSDRCRLLELKTSAAAHMVADHVCDFVFIDADHSYSAVSDDIHRWVPKVKTGGMICGHDYNREKFPGVIRAVDEAFGPRVEELPWNVWAVRI